MGGECALPGVSGWSDRELRWDEWELWGFSGKWLLELRRIDWPVSGAQFAAGSPASAPNCTVSCVLVVGWIQKRVLDACVAWMFVSFAGMKSRIASSSMLMNQCLHPPVK